jgi:hypothetical protein
MEGKRTLTIRIQERAHRDLKIISAMTGRTMGDLIEEMIIRRKREMFGDEGWSDDVRELFDQKNSETKQSERALEIREERANYKHEIMEFIGNLRDDEKLTFDEIASKLTIEGYRTLTGKGSWQGGSVYKLYKKQKDSKLPTAMELIKAKAPYGGIFDGDSEDDE